jgi:lycopene cyclase domain-containing protein
MFGPWTYIIFELAWAVPIIILQFWFARETIMRQWRLFVAGVTIPFLWLSFADRLAIGDGIWEISLERSLGIFILGLPLEEAVFFLITNLLIVLGLMALSSPEAWARMRRIARRLAPGGGGSRE